MARPTAFAVGGLAGLLAVLSLLVVPGLDPGPAAASGPTHIVAHYARGCLEGHLWPGGVQLNIDVKDSGGNVIYTTTATTDASGNFIAHLKADGVFCDIPVHLSPGMTYTASDGSTTKTLVIESLTFDQLDPEVETAVGTAPADRLVQVYSYWDTSGQDLFVKADPVSGPGGDWFVNVGAIGGKVELGSRADAFLRDDGADGNYDFTAASIFVTSLSLGASPAGGAGSAGIAQAEGATVVRRGARVRLSGRLSARTRACTTRKRVQLQKLNGKRSSVLESGRTGKTGGYSFLRKVKRNTRFRVRYAGDRICQRSTSRVKTVRVART